MRRGTILGIFFPISALSGGAISAACSSHVEPPQPVADGSSDDAMPPPSDAGADSTLLAHTMVLSLDPTLDGDDDVVKATSITAALLLDGSGATKASATIADGVALFDLAAITAGDYFVQVNGDADDLVPSRIDDPNRTIVQRVGQKLRASTIGLPDAPIYRINTYPDGTVVEFLTGAPIANEHPYLLYTYKPSKLEIRLLGSPDSVSTFPLAPCAGHPYGSTDSWLLNTANQDHHGDVFNASDGGDPCYACHGDGWRRQVSWDFITPSRGWCFKCHEGPEGSGAGFVHPNP